MTTGKSKPTSIDIAYLTGFSQATVSRALRNSPLVSEETRRKVQEVARQLNYKVDKNASNLRTQHSGTLALLFFEDPTADDSHINPFFVSMLGSITRACAQRGYDLLISFQQASDDWHADYADSKKADGIILLGYGDYVTYCDKARKLVEQGTHFVRWGAVLPDQPDTSIGCDNYSGGRVIAEHLLEQGCKRIAFLGEATRHYPEFFERHHGYAEALEDAGLEVDPELQVDAESTQGSGHAAMVELLERNVQFDAVFAASDLIAIGAMRALDERGLRVPEDVAVAGFDDVPSASFAHPPLTTVRQDTKEAGSILVDNLLHLIHGDPVETSILPIRLVVRKSSVRGDATR
ncbi:LacI family DNA-binding transcriptional regulator [Oleiagrimonas sp. MCCC 1A03011]|uniref:LacI family DNA-binding transcriptional regulator n=1 Tax=Oleiagrimonas sp. MCCC 1A03011 TaxID=1926883 RepID=UPI000DC40DB4|nr:LacI family DNA-binding transcriptional regulator [Oleiagrimonas sp. MCCC 1A03011]RAP59655.1 LacI family transcriptional regulator [Oleiagrimonas sp. MCCC 1A03011]